MKIKVARPGQPSHQYSVEEINDLLAKGELNGDEMAWHEGLPKWISLARVRGIQARSSASGRSASPKKTGEFWGTLRDQSGVPTLWNPLVTLFWSVLFGPLFGVILLARNWDVLEERDQARRARLWLWPAGGYYLALFLVLLINAGLAFFVVLVLGWLLLVPWYLTVGSALNRFITGQLQGQFFRRPWGKPILLALGTAVIYAALLGLGMIVMRALRNG
jgi:succinate dehydrogenase/fumarate reductase cytochrome b subunit